MPNSKPDSVMTNDNAQIATLGIRVSAIEGQVQKLSANVDGVQTALSTKIDSIATTLSSKIDERGRTPWAIYLAGAMAIFSLYSYITSSQISPLKEADASLGARMDRIGNKMETDMVPARTHAREWALNDERFSRVEERLKLVDDRIKSAENGILERIRFGETSQTERIKRIEDSYSNTYNMRDALQQLDNRIQHFERMNADKRAAN